MDKPNESFSPLMNAVLEDSSIISSFVLMGCTEIMLPFMSDPFNRDTAR